MSHSSEQGPNFLQNREPSNAGGTEPCIPLQYRAGVRNFKEVRDPLRRLEYLRVSEGRSVWVGLDVGRRACLHACGRGCQSTECRPKPQIRVRGVWRGLSAQNWGCLGLSEGTLSSRLWAPGLIAVTSSAGRKFVAIGSQVFRMSHARLPSIGRGARLT